LEANTAPGGGGGAVFLVGDFGFSSANSTYFGNSALFGGGLNLQANGGFGPDVLIGTSTFVGNESSFPGAADQIYGTWNNCGLYNSIIAHDPAAPVLLDPFCIAPLDEGQHNLIDDASCDTGLAGFQLGQVIGLDFKLRYNGGLTRTHAIDATSNAVDAGRNAACRNPHTGAALVVDQRGEPRPVDFDLNGTAESDIGAKELQ